MNATRRGPLIAVLVAAALALTGSVAVVAYGASRTTVHGPAAARGPALRGGGPGGGYGPGMMGGPGTTGGPGMMGGPGTTGGPGMMGGGAWQSGGGMMGGGAWQSGGRFGLPGTGAPVTTPAAARSRAQAFADQLGDGLRAGEIMQFGNGFYGELTTAAGAGATEVLIDPRDGAVSIEFGPAMMWNIRYGMHPAAAVAPRVSAEQARSTAQAWLDARRTGLTAGDVTAFPGYYTLHTRAGGTISGMMSVHAGTGAVWYHTWHGTFVAMSGS
jgi:hypothetical protein